VSLFSVPSGYLTIFNATHYEFDVNVYSPIGTVVFEALLLVEMTDERGIVLVDFQDSAGTGGVGDIEPFSINGMGNSDVISPVTGDVLITITTDELLNHTDTNVIYRFQVVSLASIGSTTESEAADVILYEIGEWKY